MSLTACCRGRQAVSQSTAAQAMPSPSRRPTSPVVSIQPHHTSRAGAGAAAVSATLMRQSQRHWDSLGRPSVQQSELTAPNAAPQCMAYEPIQAADLGRQGHSAMSGLTARCQLVCRSVQAAAAGHGAYWSDDLGAGVHDDINLGPSGQVSQQQAASSKQAEQQRRPALDSLRGSQSASTPQHSIDTACSDSSEDTHKLIAACTAQLNVYCACRLTAAA